MRKSILSISLIILLTTCAEDDKLPPAKPELESPSDNSLGTELNLTFSWSEPEEANSYSFQLSVQQDFKSIETNLSELSSESTQIEDLKPSTIYYWRVNAKNETGTSPWSSTNKFTTKSLAVPTLIAPEENSTQSIKNIPFSWNTITDVSSYDLQISTTSDFTGLIISKTNLTSASIILSDFMYSTNYYWRVSSTRNNSNSEWSAVRKFTTQALGIPELVLPENDSKPVSKNITFEWSAVVGASGYNLEVSNSADFSSLVVNKTNLSSLTFSVSDFRWNTKYYWRANAMVANCQSEWSTPRSFTPSLPVEGLVAWYPFNGNANDESGNNNNGTIHGGVVTTSDRFNESNKAYIFNGTSGYIEIPTLNNFQYKPITYSAWVIVNSYFPLSPGHKFRSIIGRQEQFNTTCGLVGFYADQNVAGGAYDNTFLYWMGAVGTPDIPYSKLKPTVSTWVHVVFTQSNNGNFTYYINGGLSSTGSITDIQNANISFRIGAGIGANSFFWNDKIDDVRIYNRVLTSEEIIALYNE